MSDSGEKLDIENEPFKYIEALEQGLINEEVDKYVLRLYVAGSTSKSARALDKISKICQEHLKGRYELEVIDIYKEPHRLEEDQIVAIPTLIKKLPPPLQKFVGDMANTEKVLLGLDIWPYNK